ncbi:MAG: hypothetical protein QXG18_00250 [Candidatus Pacearchaeota archaeon]
MKNTIFFILFFNLFIFFANAQSFSNPVNLYGNFNNVQEYPSFSAFTDPTDIGDFWPILKDMQEGKCEAATDFVVLIPPGGCTPPVVRSDLLAEQNVPVFCKLVAIQLNPLIKVSSIRSISFKGNYPREIAGIRFYPARAGASTFYRSLNNNPLEGPLASEIGYAVIILKKTPNESAITKWISGNATVNLVYDAEQTFGLGKSEFFLEVVSDEDWGSESRFSSFWNGRMSLRLLDIEKDKARIALYVDNKERPYRVLTLKEGEISDLIYLPGFYCMAGVRARLNSVDGVEDSAILQVGDEIISVRKNSRILNGRCSVRDISINSNEVGYVRINCGGKDFYLILSSAYKPNITIENSWKIFEVGEKFLEGDRRYNSWYISYSVEKSNSKINGEERAFVVLVSEESNRELDIGKIKRIRDALRQVDVKEIEYSNKEEFIKSVERYTGLRNEKGFALLFIEDSINLNGKNIKFNNIVLSDEILSSSDLKKSLNNELKKDIDNYFEKNEKALKELYQLYKGVKDETGTRYSERAYLERLAIMEKLVNLDVKNLPELNSLREDFLQRFPDSKSVTKIRGDLENSGVYDRKNSASLVEVNGKLIPITLLSFSKKNPEDKKAEIYIDNIKYYVTENLQANLTLRGRINKEDYFVIEKITKDYVQIKFFIEENKRDGKDYKIIDRRFSLEKEDSINIDEGRYNVLVDNIEIKRSVHITLIPEERNIRSEANFSFRVGVEKRLFQLNPDKSEEKLKRLNETIKKWEEKRDNLGKVVEGLKKSCFFAGVGLQIKNLIEGFSGKAIARKEVMQIYREMCINDDRYKSGNKEVARARCYSEMAPLIEQDVNAYTEAIKKSNEELKKYKTIDEWRNTNKNVLVGSINGKDIKGEDLTTWAQVRNYLIKKNIPSSVGSSYLTEGIDRKLNDSIIGIAKLKIEEDRQRELNNQLQKYIIVRAENLSNFRVHSTQEVQRFSSTGLKSDYLRESDVVGRGKKIELINTRKNGTLLVVLTHAFENEKSEFKVELDDIYKEKSGGGWEKINIDNDGDLKAELSSLRFIDGGNCKNQYKGPRVRYFTSSYAKGMPAIVPFDEKEGWYVRVSQSQGELFSSEAKGYTEAGLPRFFYICNVGPNGREENMGGDDICQSFDVNNYDKVGRFGGCSEMLSSEVLRLAEDAQEAIRQAASQYNDVKNGAKEILIKTKRGLVKAKVGEEFFSDRPGQECYDFMSPTDCNLLFNVCDPVVCPPSRCDFGGKAPVDNVIASGIAGSLILCLPNFGNPTKGGVVIPICLTGVHAGIDAYLSILRAQYNCIDQAKKTGKYLGVCDYFTAVYTCEFFWRNAQPFMKNIVPRIFEFMNDPSSLGRPRGGGEYLTFQKSWESVEESMNYFKNNYAKTSFRIFSYSDIGEFGSEFCRSFIGTSFPTKGKALDQLFKPESPTQFYAEFSEIPFTEATVPPTSQYKVLYHIYAGNDQSGRYSVYLRDPPASSVSQSYPQVLVGSGIIQRGGYVSESKDFTAPSGYKQLCVQINEREYCGFKQVTSDVGLDYLAKMQAREEAEKTGIETESQCVSGSSSIAGLTSSFNVQEGVQSSVKPELYRMGIVRVCSSENPGKGTSEETKWKIVGYCGNTNIKCWLSKDSINQNTISLLGMVGTVKKAEEVINNPNLISTAMTEEETRAILTYIKTMISDLSIKTNEDIDYKIKPIIDNISKVEKEGAFDFLQAEAHYLKTLLYLRIVDILANFNSVKIEAPALTQTEIKREDAKREEVPDDRNKKLEVFNKKAEIKYKGDIYQVTNIIGSEIFLHKIIGGKLSPGAPKKCLTYQTVEECLS